MSGALNAMAFASGGFSATVSPSAVVGYGFPGAIATPSVTVTVQGGVGPFTYAWTRTSGVGGVANVPNAATTQFVVTTGTDLNSSFTCVVTDTTTGETVSVSAGAAWVVYI